MYGIEKGIVVPTLKTHAKKLKQETNQLPLIIAVFFILLEYSPCPRLLFRGYFLNFKLQEKKLSISWLASDITVVNTPYHNIHIS